MEKRHWETLLSCAHTNDFTRQRLVRQLIDSDVATQVLQMNGYGAQDQSLLEMVTQIPPKEERP